MGIVINSEQMECRLPEDKLQDLRFVVNKARGAKKIRLRDLQSPLNSILHVELYRWVGFFVAGFTCDGGGQGTFPFCTPFSCIACRFVCMGAVFGAV